MPNCFKKSEFALKLGKNRTQTEWEIKKSQVWQERGFTSTVVLKYFKKTDLLHHSYWRSLTILKQRSKRKQYYKNNKAKGTFVMKDSP